MKKIIVTLLLSLMTFTGYLAHAKTLYTNNYEYEKYEHTFVGPRKKYSNYRTKMAMSYFGARGNAETGRSFVVDNPMVLSFVSQLSY
jgi:hypothetical protein